MPRQGREWSSWIQPMLYISPPSGLSPPSCESLVSESESRRKVSKSQFLSSWDQGFLQLGSWKSWHFRDKRFFFLEPNSDHACATISVGQEEAPVGCLIRATTHLRTLPLTEGAEVVILRGPLGPGWKRPTAAMPGPGAAQSVGEIAAGRVVPQ